jgi:lipid II:glycine glycyltransferase (peptidoglycan interpeptide bridge formation enzyme)
MTGPVDRADSTPPEPGGAEPAAAEPGGAESTASSASIATLRSDDAAWDAFVAHNDLGFHTQLTPWATVKAANGWDRTRVVADGGSGPIGAQILTRRIGPGPFGVGYAPRGPVATTWDAASLDAFSAAVRRTARRLRLSHVTFEPPLEPETFDGAAALFRDAGWRKGHDVQPQRTWEVPLARPEEELWSGLRSKWRQYIGKARRAGTVVTEAGRDDLPQFYEIFLGTAQRTGFIPRTYDSYVQVWDAFAPSGAAKLLFARHSGGEPAAVLFIVRSGGRVVEPYGGMTLEGAASRANYLLKWEAIRRSNETGARVYDMWGLAHAGIEQFKVGFGGREAGYVGAFDLVTLPILRDAVVTGRRLWVPLARRVYAARHAGNGATARGDGAVTTPADA